MQSELLDKILFYKIKKKDKDAFVKAYDLHMDDIYRFVFFKVSNQEVAEDISSAVFLKSWDYILNNSVSDYKTLKSLFYKVARNLVIDHYRKKSTSSEVSIERNEDGQEVEMMDDGKNLEDLTDVKMKHESILEKLNELKDEYREVIVLRFVNELSINEISKIIKKSNGGTRVMIHRALKALRDLLEK